MKGGKILSVKGFAYIRTADMNLTEGIKRQKDKIEAYCKVRGIDDIEYFIYYGAGGNLAQNDEFSRLKESIGQAAGEHPVFIVHSIDRVTRDLREWQEVLSDMRQMGVECCVVKGEHFSPDFWLQQELAEAANQMNPEYAASCDEVDETIPKLLVLKSLDEDRTAMIMSDGKKYYLLNDEISEMIALNFRADKCRVSENGRKIIMEEDDRQFPVADMVDFMYPLAEREDSHKR